MQTTPPGQAPVAGVPAVQVPPPLQDAGVVVSWLPLQEVVPVQDVPAEAKAQAPLPLAEAGQAAGGRPCRALVVGIGVGADRRALPGGGAGLGLDAGLAGPGAAAVAADAVGAEAGAALIGGGAGGAQTALGGAHVGGQAAVRAIGAVGVRRARGGASRRSRSCTPPRRGRRRSTARRGRSCRCRLQAAGVMLKWLPVQDVVPELQAVPDAVSAQPPLPSQRPVAPHIVVPTAHSMSGSVCDGGGRAVTVGGAGLGRQRRPGRGPPQPALQQTPSVQKPEVRWSVAVQQAPPRSRWAVHTCMVRSQYEPGAQAVSSVHAEGRQAVALMQATPPGQAEAAAVPRTQAPAPSQAAGVTVSWLPVQVWCQCRRGRAAAKTRTCRPRRRSRWSRRWWSPLCSRRRRCCRPAARCRRHRSCRSWSRRTTGRSLCSRYRSRRGRRWSRHLLTHWVVAVQTAPGAQLGRTAHAALGRAAAARGPAASSDTTARPARRTGHAARAARQPTRAAAGRTIAAATGRARGSAGPGVVRRCRPSRRRSRWSPPRRRSRSAGSECTRR